MNVNERLLGLEGCLNARELGGYQTFSGKTSYGFLIRADATHQLTANDVAKLKELGVTQQVDLRSAEEIKKAPSLLEIEEEIRYEHVDMLDHIHSDFFQNLPDMTEMYCGLLDDCKEKYARIFRKILKNPKATIFNCTAGKDRTGVLTMLILKLAGVNDEIIIEDYAVSGENMKPSFQAQRDLLKEEGIILPEYIFLSKPEDMRNTINYLHQKYGNVEEYLLQSGLSREEMYLFRQRFVQ